MYRGILIALLSGVILLAFAALPPMLPGSTTVGLSGSAQAEKAPTPTTDAVKLNSSRSNVDRMGGGGGTKAGGNPAKVFGNFVIPGSAIPAVSSNGWMLSFGGVVNF